VQWRSARTGEAAFPYHSSTVEKTFATNNSFEPTNSRTSRVIIKMGNLAELFLQIACEVETESAAPGAPGKDGGFHIWEGFLSGRLRLAH
jgi:hypothetical protein